MQLLMKEEVNWREFGKDVLTLDQQSKENYLNELTTLNSQYEKLEKIVNLWISDPESNWHKLAITLAKLGHKTLAEEAAQKHRRHTCKSG